MYVNLYICESMIWKDDDDSSVGGAGARIRRDKETGRGLTVFGRVDDLIES